MGVVPKSSAGWEKGVEAHSPDSKLRDNPFADYQPDHEAATVPPASAAFDPEAARYASFQVQQEPAPMACGCGLQFVLCGPLPPFPGSPHPHEDLRQATSLSSMQGKSALQSGRVCLKASSLPAVEFWTRLLLLLALLRGVGCAPAHDRSCFFHRFLVGFIFPPTWYVGACMLPFLTDRR